VELEMKIAKQLEGVHPGLELPGLVAEKSGALADRGQKFPRAHGAGEFERGRFRRRRAQRCQAEQKQDRE
jgi:hypothetical protein